MIPSVESMDQGPPRPPTETEKTTMADEKRKSDHPEGAMVFCEYHENEPIIF